MEETNNIQIAKYFNMQEFECPCCHCVMIHPKLLKLLIKLRRLVMEPIYINSGYRCKKENKKVGGVKSSYHRFGMAVDITVNQKSMHDLAIMAESVGFLGIGLYDTFCHLDIRDHREHWEG
jgi:uncharacterized protein YcbK (DUF882 family)